MPVRLRPSRRSLAWGVAALTGVPLLARLASGASAGPIEIADMRWTDVAEAVARGTRTAIVPTGGLEQNGPHMIIGKHDRVVRWAACRLATELGHALVAPVVSYVPEGDYDPPSGNMGVPGALGVSPAVFEGVLDGIARSLKAGGFTTICFMSDHGGSVKPQAAVASRLNEEWRGIVRVIDVSAYYSDELESSYLRSQGETEATMGQHGGIADTSELMAAYPEGVDMARLPTSPDDLARLGASGDPRRATLERGQALLQLRIDAAARQVRAAMATT